MRALPPLVAQGEASEKAVLGTIRRQSHRGGKRYASNWFRCPGSSCEYPMLQ